MLRNARNLSIALLVASCSATTSAESGVLRGRITIVPSNEPGAALWVRVDRVGEAITGFPAGKISAEDESMVAYTDTKGEFLLERVPPGIYEVAIQQESLPSRFASVGRPKRTVLVSKTDRAEVSLEVSTQASLEGRVTREDGLPTRGCQVLLSHRGESVPFRQLETDESGAYRAGDLEPGVPVVVEVRAPEGVYRRAETTPLHAGVHPFEMALPLWSRTARQRVVLDVAIPRVGESPLLLLWQSVPLEAAQGFTVEVPMSREGRSELEAPPGVYSVTVRELTLRKRRWQADRLYRVEQSASPLHIMVTVQELPTETASHENP